MPGAPPIGLKAAVREALRAKSGLLGFSMLGLLLVVSVAVPIYAPYNVVSAWSSPSHWVDNPRSVPPEWVGAFSGKHPPQNIVARPADFKKEIFPSSLQDQTHVYLNKTIDFQYDGFPSELALSIWASFQTTAQVTVRWIRPDGQQLVLFQDAPSLKSPDANDYPLSSVSEADPFIKALHNNIRSWIASTGKVEPALISQAIIYPEVVLFAQVDKDMFNSSTAQVLKGPYYLNIIMLGFDRTDNMDAKFIAYGQVYGLAGTDGLRRDLLVGLLWGAPVALAFGTAAALVVVLVQTILGAASGWYGGLLDELVQRGSDFFLIIPLLPILVIFSLIYDRPGLLVILGVVVAFGVLGSTSKVVRSLVIQIKEEQFIEAARSYGATRGRILFRYILPRIMPYTFALIALNVPAFIFLEASLSFLGLGDPRIPTWGSILGQAYTGGALYVTPPIWWWVALPASGILFAAVAFSLLGYSFDKVLNPRLREE